MVRRISGTRLSPPFCLFWLMAIGAAASLEAEMICGAPLEAAVPLLDAISGGLEDGNVQAFETAGHTCCDMLKEATVAAHGIAESTGQANAFIDAAAQIATKGNLKSSCARIVLVEVVAGMPLPAEPNLEEMANETAVETKEEAIASAASQPTAVSTQWQPPPPAVAKTSGGSNSPPGSPRPPQSKSPPATQQTRSRAAAAKSGSGASNSNANAAQPRVSSGNGQQQRGNSAPQQASRGQLNQPPGAGVSPPGKRGV